MYMCSVLRVLLVKCVLCMCTLLLFFVFSCHDDTPPVILHVYCTCICTFCIMLRMYAHSALYSCTLYTVIVWTPLM